MTRECFPICLVTDKRSDQLLRLYFECVYTYAPVLDRIQFVRSYESGKYSLFLLQSVFANVVPYASSELLCEAGFQDHLTAQRTFFERATLLYDLRSEKRHLQLLQGSILLSSSTFPSSEDRDHRFWLTNAVRIAMKLGLHRDKTANEVDHVTRLLFRRIWWVLYHRDVCLTIFGVDDVRRLHDTDFDTAPLTEKDWDEEHDNVPQHLDYILVPITRLEKVYLVENCKLAQISRCSRIMAGFGSMANGDNS